MGLRSVLLELDTISRFQETQDFINKYNKKYYYIGLIYHEPTNKYYMMIECETQFFCRTLSNELNANVSNIEQFDLNDYNNTIEGAIYFDDEQQCLSHYNSV